MFTNFLIFTALLLANAFFVASEFAIVSIRTTRLSQLAHEGNKEAAIALNSIEHLDKSIAATQLGITISSIGLGWVGEGTLATIIEPIFNFLPEMSRQVTTHSISVTIAFSLITLFHVVLGELMPKSVALQYTEKTVLLIARPLAWITKLFTPFIWILNGCGNFMLSLFKIPPAHTERTVCSVEEIDMIIDASHKEGVLNDTEKEVLQNVFKFSDIQAKQVMVPRPDVVAIPVDITFEELNKIILESQYTRYPVYEEDLDHVLGILHVKDVYPLVLNGAEIRLKDIIRKTMLVPETVTMDNLLIEFKEKKSQMAIVFDEFGGTSGIITLEDVFEEVFGEVQDEFDEEEAEIKQVKENEYVANAMFRLDEFNEFFETEEFADILEDDDVETLGGVVIKYLGRVAVVGDEVVVGDFVFKVLEVDGARVIKIKIIKNISEKVDSHQEI